MANKKVGTKTGKQTQAGRDVYVTPEGENVSEKSTTFKYKGKWINVPSIHDGHRYDDDTLKIMLEAEIITPTSTHENRQEAEAAAKKRSDELKFNKGGTPMKDQMELFEDGGLKDEGGTVDEVSGNEVPIGGTKKGVRDDVPAMVSEGEFVFPEDVTRYIGLDKLMQMRQEAKMGLKRMEAMGQMGNGDEATIPDDMPFSMADLVIVAGDTGEELEMQEGGFVTRPTTVTRTQPQSTYTSPPQQFTTAQPTTVRRLTPEIQRPQRSSINFKKLMGEASISYVEYRNAAGANMMIPHVGGVPVFPIPEGYTKYEGPDVDENAGETEIVNEVQEKTVAFNEANKNNSDPIIKNAFVEAGSWDNSPIDMYLKEALKFVNGTSATVNGLVSAVSGGVLSPFVYGFSALEKRRILATIDDRIKNNPEQAADLLKIKKALEEGKPLQSAIGFVTNAVKGIGQKIFGLEEEQAEAAATNTIQTEIEQVAPSYATMDMGEAGRTSRPMQEQVVSTQPAETAPVYSFIATDPRVSQTPVGAVADPTITNPDHRLIYGDSFSAGNNKFTIQNTGRIYVTNPLGGTVEVNPLGRSLKNVQDEILNITGQPVTYTGPSPEEIVMQQPISVPVGPTGGYDEQPIMQGAEILGQLEAPIMYGQPSPTAAKVEITPYEGSVEQAAGLSVSEQMRRMTEEREQQRKQVIDPEFTKGIPEPDFDPRGRNQIPTVEQKQSSLSPVPVPVGLTGSYDEVPSSITPVTAATAPAPSYATMDMGEAGRTKQVQVKSEPKKVEISFDEAFIAAREAEKKAGKKSGTSKFEYKGKSYTTETAKEKDTRSKTTSTTSRADGDVGYMVAGAGYTTINGKMPTSEQQKEQRIAAANAKAAGKDPQAAVNKVVEKQKDDKPTTTTSSTDKTKNVASSGRTEAEIQKEINAELDKGGWNSKLNDLVKERDSARSNEGTSGSGDSGGSSTSSSIGGGYSCYVATALSSKGYWSNTRKLKLIKWCIDAKPEGKLDTKLWRNGYVTFGKNVIAPRVSNKIIQWLSNGFYYATVYKKKNIQAIVGKLFFYIPSYTIGIWKALRGKLVDIERT